MFKLKKLAAATLLALGFAAGSTQAAIDPDTRSLTAGLGTADNVRGELFLSVVARNPGNPTQNNSYVRDLGVRTDVFLTGDPLATGLFGAGDNVLEADASMQQFLADNTGFEILFSVTGINADKSKQQTGSFPNFTTTYGKPGILTTGNADLATVQALQPQTQQAMNAATDATWVHISNINSDLDGKSNEQIDETDIANNNSGRLALTDIGHHDKNFGRNVLYGFDTEGALDGTVSFFWIGLQGEAGAGQLEPTTPIELGTWRLLANGDLQLVPIPAAAWLFGSALLGLAGISRRRAA